MEKQFRLDLGERVTVAQNVGYVFRAQKVPRSERRRRVAAVMETVGLGALAGPLVGRRARNPARLCVRPDDLSLEAAPVAGGSAPHPVVLPVRVLSALYQGAATLVTVTPEPAPDIPLTLRYPGADARPEGTRAGLRINAAWVGPHAGTGAQD